MGVTERGTGNFFLTCTLMEVFFGSDCKTATYKGYRYLLFRSHASPALRQARRSAAQTTAIAEKQQRQLSRSPHKRVYHSRTRSVDNKEPKTKAPAGPPPKLQRSSSVRQLNRKNNPSSERANRSITPSNDTKTKHITPGKGMPEIPSMIK